MNRRRKIHRPHHDEDDPNTSYSVASSTDSVVSETISEEGSTVTVQSTQKLQDDLARALAEVERLTTSLALLGTSH